MSISPLEHERIKENYQKVRNKVISVVGVDVLSSNHYGAPILYNEYIDLDTEDAKIIEICKKFANIYNQIEAVFKNNNMELKEEYFVEDPFSGLCFLGVYIDVYKGFSFLEPTINDFISLYKRIYNLSSKYSNLGKIDFCKSSNNNDYYLYKQKIEFNTQDKILNNILSSHDKLNKKVNDLLAICNYNGKDLLYPSSNVYYLFGNRINEDTSSEDLIKIINSAQLFESNIKCVLKELKIIEEYTIKYETDIFVWFAKAGHKFNLSMLYDEIKKELIETDKWYHFKKN